MNKKDYWNNVLAANCLAGAEYLRELVGFIDYRPEWENEGKSPDTLRREFDRERAKY